MIAQMLLEGQTYVTISLVTNIIYKIRKGIQEAIGSPTATDNIRSIVAEMIQVFSTHFAQGGAGMVAIENLETGDRKQPKGINIFLDPRIKCGVGLSNEDNDIIYEKSREAIIEITAMELEHAQPKEQQQQPAQHCQQIQGHQAEDKDIFDDFNKSYVTETANRVNDVDREELVVNVVIAANAELALYKQAP